MRSRAEATAAAARGPERSAAASTGTVAGGREGDLVTTCEVEETFIMLSCDNNPS